MKEDDRFSPLQLEAIEARLWAAVNRMSLLDVDMPPVSSMLGATPDCQLYSDSLVQYAAVPPQSETPSPQDRALLEHLSACTQCQDTLEQLRAARRTAPKLRIRSQRPVPDIDLTLFDGEISRLDPTLRSALDPRRPALLFSGFLQQPLGWHFVLETDPHADGSEPDLLLTLTPAAGTAADVNVTLITFGQVLHGTTNHEGQARFSHLLIPVAEFVETPVLSLQVHPQESEAA